MQRKLLTVCLRYDDRTVDLMMKKEGFGAGRWNGYGGKAEDGEDIIASAAREVLEECGCAPLGLERRAVLDFYFEDIPKIFETHVFRILGFDGEPRETREMGPPRRFLHAEVPYGPTMWPADEHWMPLALQGKRFRGKFYYKDMDTLLRYEIEEVTAL